MAPPEIPDYRDLRLIGRGGFAEVFEATQPAFGGRLVAVKVLTVDGLDQDRQRRFESECHAAGRISWHPNVVNVYDAGVTEDGRPYLVMEHLRRGSLGDLIADGPIGWQEAVALAIPLAGALEAAHRAELVHRDVKPANVLIGPLDEPKLADFGIARVEGSAATRTGGVRATLAHASPEALEGHAGPPSDVYALASTLYELVAGTPAFVRPDDETVTPVIARIMSAPVPDLRPLGVPDEVASVVEGAMAKEPERRPESAAALGRALQEAAGALGQPPVRMLISLDDAPTSGARAHEAPASVPPASPTEAGQDALPGPDPHHPPGAGESEALDPSATVHVPAAAPPPLDPAGEPSTARTGADPSSRASRRRALVVGAVVAVALVVAGAAALLLSQSGDGDDSGGGASDAAEESESEPTNADTAARTATSTIEVGSSPLGVAVSGSTVFVANLQDGTLSLLDVDSGEVRGTVDAEGQPRRVAASTTDGVWVTLPDADAVAKANEDGVGQTLPVGDDPVGVIEAFGSAWVVNRADGTTTRIDAESQEQIAVVEGVGDDPRQIVAGDDAVWVSDAGSDQVRRIDPDTNRVTDAVDVGAEPIGLAFGQGGLWVTSAADGTLSQIDPETLEVVATVEVGNRPVSAAVGLGSVWVTNQQDDSVSRVDVTTGALIETIGVGDQPAGVATSEGAVWVTNLGSDTLTLIRVGPG